MPTYAYATERRDELLERCAPVPEDWAGRYVDDPAMRNLPLDARPGLRTLDDVLNPGDTVCLWNLGDVWGTLLQARRQLSLWHAKGVTVKLLALDVTLGQNAPEMLRLLKGASWQKPKGPRPKVRPMPTPLMRYIGYGWITKWNAKQRAWFVSPCERTREIQGMILKMLDDTRPGQVATALNIGKLWVRARKRLYLRGATLKQVGATANTLTRWTARRVAHATERELELREFEHAYECGSLPASFGKITIGKGWFAPPTEAETEVRRVSTAYSNLGAARRRRRERRASLARRVSGAIARPRSAAEGP